MNNSTMPGRREALFDHCTQKQLGIRAEVGPNFSVVLYQEETFLLVGIVEQGDLGD